MKCRQDWRPLLVSLEAYIETTGDTSPIHYLSQKYATAPTAGSGAVLSQIGALLGQAQQLIQQSVSSDCAADTALPDRTVADIECAPDGSWLRVGDRELRGIRGYQQDFVLTMVDAYRKGNRRPKVEWAFRVAGYGEGTYDLRHITRRKEFFDFFAQGGGECWIVTDPGCASSQTRKL